MDKKIAETFFNNVRWFNNFFNDMKMLFDKITNLLGKEGYTKKKLYYYKSNDQPSIPNAYFLMLEREGKDKVQIISVFNNEYISNKYLKITEPSLIVIQHDYKYNSEHIGYNILENNSIKQIFQKGEIVSGILSWDVNINFISFKVPLELFAEYDNQKVEDYIINILRQSSVLIRS